MLLHSGSSHYTNHFKITIDKHVAIQFLVLHCFKNKRIQLQCLKIRFHTCKSVLVGKHTKLRQLHHLHVTIRENFVLQQTVFQQTSQYWNVTLVYQYFCCIILIFIDVITATVPDMVVAVVVVKSMSLYGCNFVVYIFMQL